MEISKNDFSHGRTRQSALDYLDNVELVIYLTQDVIVAIPDALQRLVSVFQDEKIGASYGRQLPRKDASHLERNERLFNYPELSIRKSYSERLRYGVKTAFISNSFATYRIDALKEVGGFPCNVILAHSVIVMQLVL